VTLSQTVHDREERGCGEGVGLYAVYMCHRGGWDGDGVCSQNRKHRQKLYLVEVYYESMKRKLKIKPIYECRCVERLQANKAEESTPTGCLL
jgi:hypothetical protein